MTRLLLAEDEPDLAQALARGLRDEAYIVDVARDGGEALWAAGSGQHDALVLDVRMPVLDGNEVCRRLRAAGSRLPVLMLTACDDTRDVVKGLDAGADDFMAKPFAIAELRARVRALGRRGAVTRDLVYVFDDVRLDLAGRAAHRGERPVAVTAKEWSILEVLAKQAGRFVSRTDLLEGVWGDASESAAGSLQVLIARLRRKLGPNLIKTLRGEGYSLAEGRKIAP